MQSLPAAVRSNLAYVFVVAGILWLGAVYVTGSSLVFWPVVACVLSGALLRLRPSSRFTLAWTVASAAMGLVLSAYQVYVAIPLLSGEFADVATASLVVFLVFALFHVYLLAASGSRGLVKSDDRGRDA